ncbi:uncharacterized protein [Centroberyx affinis]|uniref:uncharacterized protein n=1 Tax=Centroberyx affinis TaxID=166261 RepID=UPI003A5BA269
MGNEYDALSNNISTDSRKVIFPEVSECFICRDVELVASDPLRNFCDCKNLLAHHVCLSTWIQKGHGEDRLRCMVCKAKYQLQWNSPWRSVSHQWQTWLVLITASVLLGLVPYVVHCMMTAFNNPPPPSTFKVAAACFGILTETLLIKCLSSFLSSRYQRAEQSSFTVQARGFKEDRMSPGLWDRSEAASAAAGHASSVVSPSQVEERKVDVVKSRESSARSSLIDLGDRRETEKPQPAESEESICSKATSPRPDHHLQKNSEPHHAGGSDRQEHDGGGTQMGLSPDITGGLCK